MLEHNWSMSLNHHVPIFKRTPTGLGGWGGPRWVSDPLPPPVTSPVLGHVTLLSGPRALSWTAVPVSVCTHYRFSTSETEVNPPPPHSDLFLPGRKVFFFLLLYKQAGFFFSRFPWSEINLSITHECKGYLSMTWRRVLHRCSHTFLSVRLQRYLKKCNVCFFFSAWWRVQITG